MTGRARSFGAVAADYDRLRPAPAVEALRWLLPSRASRVLDLAAGTGLVTRALTAEGHDDVVAVEPDDAMRAVLQARSPGVRALPGTAETIPLPDGSVDAVLAASAWHWFDPERAASEIGRVLRPGGVLGLLWSYSDPDTDWVADLRRIGRAEAQGSTSLARTGFSVEMPDAAPFGAGESRIFRRSAWMLADDVAAMLGTSSSVLVLPADERRDVHRRARALITERVGADPVLVPFVTAVFRTSRA